MGSDSNVISGITKNILFEKFNSKGYLILLIIFICMLIILYYFNDYISENTEYIISRIRQSVKGDNIDIDKVGISLEYDPNGSPIEEEEVKDILKPKKCKKRKKITKEKQVFNISDNINH